MSRKRKIIIWVVGGFVALTILGSLLPDPEQDSNAKAERDHAAQTTKAPGEATDSASERAALREQRAKLRQERAALREQRAKLRQERAEARAAVQHERERREAEAAAAAVAPEPAPADSCDPNYDPCVPPYPPDLDCADVGGPIAVTGSDPHGFDADGDGAACES